MAALEEWLAGGREKHAWPLVKNAFRREGESTIIAGHAEGFVAKIWMFKSGIEQNGEPVDDRPLDFCVDELQLRQNDWIAPLERKDRLIIGEEENPTLAPYRGLRFVVVEINNDDLNSKRRGWRTGYYLLKSIDTTQASKILQRETRH